MTKKDLIKKSQVENAVETLLKLIKATDKSSVNLIDGAKKIDLQFILTKLPMTRHKIKLDLPHSIDEDVREVCIFVKDLDLKDREYEKTVFHYQDLFKKKGVTKIAKIIPIKALRTDYCQPHNKRTLAKAYDLFLADGTIKGLLPALLGKIFYAQNKSVPRQVNLAASNLKEHLDKVINNPECEISGKGSSSSVQIGNDGMSKAEIVSNTLEAVRILCERVPGGRNNIKSLLIRTSEITAIPLYTNYINPEDIDLPMKERVQLASYTDDVTTVEDALVYVRSDGLVKVLSNKRKSEMTDDDLTDKKPKLEEVKVENDNTESDGTKAASNNKKQSKSKAKGQKKSRKGKKDVITTDDEVKVEDEATDVIEIKEEIPDDEEKKSRKRKSNKDSPVDNRKENEVNANGKKKKGGKKEIVKPESKVLKTSNASMKKDKSANASTKKSPKEKTNTRKSKK